MNSINFGKNIARLRKKMGLTQLALAKMLSISDKAVSKWENGGGYPEITLLPQLSDILGVSVDSLLKGDTSGIAVAGTITLDIINEINKFPKKGTLSNVIETKYKIGGCVPGTAVELSTIDRDVYVVPIGKIGNDDNGRKVLNSLMDKGIDTSRIRIDNNLSTATSYVLHEISDDFRTYFYDEGANAAFGFDDVDVDSLDCKIFHLGYIMLLKSLDTYDEKYGTKTAALLNRVAEKNIKTSFTLSCDNPNFNADKIIPLFEYIDYPILNCSDCAKLTGINPEKNDGSISITNAEKSLEKIMKLGVKGKAILYAREYSFVMDSSGKLTGVADFNLDYIRTQDANDAFVSMCLYALYKGYEDEKLLEFATAASAMYSLNVRQGDIMRNKDEIKRFIKKYKHK